MDSTEIQRIIRDYYKHTQANKLDSLRRIGKFLEKYHLPKLNQEEMKNNSSPGIYFHAAVPKLCKEQRCLKMMSPGFPGGPVVKNPPANSGAWVPSLDWKDPTCCRATEPMPTTTKPAFLQPALHSKRVLQWEAHQCNSRAAPALHNQRKSSHSNKDPALPK